MSLRAARLGRSRDNVLKSATTRPERQVVVRSPRSVLACRDWLRLARGETLPSVVGNRAVDNGAAVNALPGVENEEEIGEAF